jgi:DNA-binding NtrC family response regulator
MQKTAILIIEDDPSIGELVLQILSEAGYTPALVGDLVAAARHRDEHGSPAAILSDLMVRGPEAPSALIPSLTAAFPDVPVALMTGVPAQRRALLGVTHDRIIDKPFDLEALLATVAALIEASSTPPLR